MDSTGSSSEKSVLFKTFKNYSSHTENGGNLIYSLNKEQSEENVLKRLKQDRKTSYHGFSDDGNTQTLPEATELTSLRPRGPVSSAHTHTSTTSLSSRNSSDNVVILEREILPSDTLQSFALLYGCTLNDLKRVNNLIKEQDFYALRQIKIPVKKYGLMTEPEEELKRRPRTGSQNNVSASSSQNFISSQAGAVLTDVYLNDSQDEEAMENEGLLLVQPSSINKTTAVEHNDATKYLKNVDKEIRNTVKSVHQTVEKKESLEEVVSSLGSVGFRPIPPPSTSKLSECDNATWGLTGSAVLISVVFGLVLVIVFFILSGVYGL